MTAPRLDGRVGRPHFGPMPTLEREIGDFAHDVLERSADHIVLAEFWAPWCTVCRRLHPALEQVVAGHSGGIELVSVNIEMQSEAAEAQGVHGLPLVKAYYRGRAIGEMTGVLSPDGMRDWVASLFDALREAGLPSPRAPPPAR